MDWNRTKTIFIVMFLCLNLFLIYQLLEKQSANQISLITEATIQERLDEMNIIIEGEMSEKQVAGVHIVGRSHEFSLEEIEGLPHQEADFLSETMIISKMAEPYQVTNESFEKNVNEFLRRYVLQGEKYRIASWNEERKQLLLFQTYLGTKIYTLENVQLVLQFNEQGQIISYQQVFLNIDEQGREQEIISSLKALEILLNEQVIKINSDITHIEIGYYSLFKPLGEVQVFAPMWRIKVDQSNYLVNAIDGSVQHLN